MIWQIEGYGHSGVAPTVVRFKRSIKKQFKGKWLGTLKQTGLCLYAKSAYSISCKNTQTRHTTPFRAWAMPTRISNKTIKVGGTYSMAPSSRSTLLFKNWDSVFSRKWRSAVLDSSKRPVFIKANAWK